MDRVRVTDMPFPEEFYYMQTKSAVHYWDIPVGSPDINRFIQGKSSYWRDPTARRDIQKKKLILADWTAFNWSYGKIDAVRQAIADRMDEGFVFYMWQDGVVKPLNKDHLANLEKFAIRRKMTAAHSQDIIQCASKQEHMASTECHVIDDYWLQYLLKKDEQEVQERHLCLSDIEVLSALPTSDPNKRLTEQANVINVLQQATPPLTLYIRDTFNLDDEPLERNLLAKLTPIPRVITQHRVATYDPAHLLEVLSQPGRTDLQSLEALQITAANWSQINEILKKTPHLIKLMIRELLHERAPLDDGLDDWGYEPLSGPQSDESESHYPHLEKLHFYVSEPSYDDDILETLLSKTTNLRSLDLLGKKSLIRPTHRLPHLTNVKISGGLSESSLNALIAAAPQLTGLWLDGAQIDLTVPFNRINHLEELLTHDQKLTAEAIQSILLNHPTLKKIQLENEGFSGLILTPNALPLMEAIEMPETWMDEKSLINLLIACPNTKTLILGGIDTRTPGLISSDHIPPLLHLEELALHANSDPGTPDLIRRLLHAAPRLKKLTMYSDPLIYVQSGTLPWLEELTLHTSRLTSRFEDLCKFSPNLKKITFNKACYLNLDQLTPGSLPLLEEITYAGVLDEASVAILKKAAPNLKKFIYEQPKKYQPVLQHYATLSRSGQGTAAAKIMPTTSASASASAGSPPPVHAADFFKPAALPSAPSERLSAPKTSDAIGRVDADTRLNPNKEFKITRIFSAIGQHLTPLVSDYRLETFDAVMLNPAICNAQDAFVILHQQALDLTPCDPLISNTDVFALASSFDHHPDHQYVYGKQTLTLTSTWQALASLSPNEELTHLHLDPPDPAIEIQYSARDNLYYIRSLSRQKTLDIDFLLKVPHKKTVLPQDIQALVAQFNRFGAKELTLPSQVSGAGYLEAIMTQETGSCRHRAIAFKAQMQRLYPHIPTRIVTNDCHAFAEVCIHHQWVSCQLGGYPAKLTINEKHNPDYILGQTPAATQVALPSTGQAIERENSKYYQHHLETWRSATSLTETYKEYCQQCTASGKIKKRLLQFDSTHSVNAMRFALQDYCLHGSKRPLFYVNSPDDLVCMAPFVEHLADHTGILRTGPGGALHDFLTATHAETPPPILLINYDNFAAEDLVRINSLLDVDRRADGTPLPENMLVIGLMNTNKPDCYQGSDFYSRFDEKETCPLTSKALAPAVPRLPMGDLSQLTADLPVINLYHAQNWKERFLGRWRMNQDQLYFEKGALVALFEQNATCVHLQNALLDDPEFKLFWQEAFVRGYIEAAGQKIPIPPDFQFISTEGYDWEKLKGCITRMEWGVAATGVTLNPTRLGTFFEKYACDNQRQTLCTLDGVLASVTDETLVVNVTRSLNDDQWAMLLTACQTPPTNVKLDLHCAPGVTIPPALASVLTAAEPIHPTLMPWDKTLTLATQIIVSTDRDTTLATLTTPSNPNDIIIDLSECNSADLLYRIHGKLKDNPPRFAFTETLGIIRRTLETSTSPEPRIILTGRCSPELADELTHYLRERGQASHHHGQICIITDDAKQFYGCPRTIHNVTTAEKRAHLGCDLFSEELLNSEPLSKLKTRRDYLTTHPDHPSDDAWLGMLHLSAQMQETTPFDAEHAREKSQAFTKARVDEVLRALEAPFIFLTGLSGVGKSTFVKKELRAHVAALHLGENQIATWANDPTPGLKMPIQI